MRHITPKLIEIFVQFSQFDCCSIRFANLAVCALIDVWNVDSENDGTIESSPATNFKLTCKTDVFLSPSGSAKCTTEEVPPFDLPSNLVLQMMDPKILTKKYKESRNWWILRILLTQIGQHLLGYTGNLLLRYENIIN
jgi:hypothetical protein